MSRLCLAAVFHIEFLCHARLLVRHAAFGTTAHGFIMSHPARFTPVIDRCRGFVVSQNPRGQWVAREAAGLTEGVFHNQRDAVRFAQFESGSPESVIVFAGGAARARSAH